VSCSILGGIESVFMECQRYCLPMNNKTREETESENTESIDAVIYPFSFNIPGSEKIYCRASSRLLKFSFNESFEISDVSSASILYSTTCCACIFSIEKKKPAIHRKVWISLRNFAFPV